MMMISNILEHDLWLLLWLYWRDTAFFFLDQQGRTGQDPIHLPYSALSNKLVLSVSLTSVLRHDLRSSSYGYSLVIHTALLYPLLSNTEPTLVYDILTLMNDSQKR